MARPKETRPAKRIQDMDLKGLDMLSQIILRGDDLDEDYEQEFTTLSTVWALLCEFPKPIVRNYLKGYKLPQRSITAIMARAEEFFGDINAVSKEAQRAKQLLWLEGIIHNENTPENLRLKAIQEHIKVTGTSNHDVVNANEIPAFPPMFLPTTEPVLADAEAVEFDDVADD